MLTQLKLPKVFRTVQRRLNRVGERENERRNIQFIHLLNTNYNTFIHINYDLYNNSFNDHTTLLCLEHTMFVQQVQRRLNRVRERERKRAREVTFSLFKQKINYNTFICINYDLYNSCDKMKESRQRKMPFRTGKAEKIEQSRRQSERCNIQFIHLLNKIIIHSFVV